MLDEVPGSNVPLHHLPGHKVVIYKEHELLKLSTARPHLPMQSHEQNQLLFWDCLLICPSTPRVFQSLGREISEEGTDTTSHTVLTEGTWRLSAFTGEVGDLETAGFWGELWGGPGDYQLQWGRLRNFNALPQEGTNTLLRLSCQRTLKGVHG